MLPETTISFDLSEVPRFQVEALTLCVANMVEHLFSDPAEEERFQAWKKERAEKVARKED